MYSCHAIIREWLGSMAVAPEPCSALGMLVTSPSPGRINVGRVLAPSRLTPVSNLGYDPLGWQLKLVRAARFAPPEI